MFQIQFKQSKYKIPKDKFELEIQYLFPLNAPIIEKYIIQSSDSRSFKVRPPIKIPKFDPKNEKHRKLSELSREAHAGSSLDLIRTEIEKIYLEIV